MKYNGFVIPIPGEKASRKTVEKFAKEFKLSLGRNYKEFHAKTGTQATQVFLPPNAPEEMKTWFKKLNVVRPRCMSKNTFGIGVL